MRNDIKLEFHKTFLEIIISQQIFKKNDIPNNSIELIIQIKEYFIEILLLLYTK